MNSAPRSFLDGSSSLVRRFTVGAGAAAADFSAASSAANSAASCAAAAASACAAYVGPHKRTGVT